MSKKENYGFEYDSDRENKIYDEQDLDDEEYKPEPITFEVGTFISNMIGIDKDKLVLNCHGETNPYLWMYPISALLWLAGGLLHLNFFAVLSVIIMEIAAVIDISMYLEPKGFKTTILTLFCGLAVPYVYPLYHAYKTKETVSIGIMTISVYAITFVLRIIMNL